MILLNDVAQVLALPKLDVHAAVGDQAPHGGRIGAALVDSDLLWHVVQVDRALEEAPRCCYVTVAVKRKSTVWPSLSTARYKYFHWPATST